ncbi:hypothetical protein AAF712_013336 [Marasmius tenuissimus]|uniref:Uncharacterized protein n=1 Tax=Marasmius tenuissimus TaxID=585030 RepID=A0ABR2ZEZ2_9AGAR|nr:hypothetical protein PM082_003808 [Marasmius tenuissimus]
MERTLIFNYKPGQLTKDVTVTLVFDPPTGGELSGEQNHVAWRVANLKSNPGSNAMNAFSVDFDSRLGFGVAQLSNGNSVIPNSLIEMKLGETTELFLNGSNPTWGPPSGSGGNGAIIRATNKTGYAQNITVGTVKDIGGGFSILLPTFMWKVGGGLTAEANFQPNLKMFVNLDYKQSDFMAGDLASIEPIWSANLSALAPTTSFAFSEADQQGYSVRAM